MINSRNKGLDNPGFEGSRTFSFALPGRDVTTLVPDYITVTTSNDLLAVKGSWFTAGHIEYAGGESIAKLASGRNLWIISTNLASSQFVLNITDFNSVYRLLMLPESLNRNEKKLCEGCVIIWPNLVVCQFSLLSLHDASLSIVL